MERNRALPRLRFRRTDPVVSISTLPDVQLAFDEVYVLPAQPTKLRRTKTCVDRRQQDGCACRKLDPDVMMVQSAEDRQRKNAAYRLDGSRQR